MIVRDFHEAFDQPAPDEPTQPDEATRALRGRLVLEEAVEVIGALNNLPDEVVLDLRARVGEAAQQTLLLFAGWPGEPIDLAAVTKELADLRYVTEGAAVALGLPLDEAYEIVHASNMSKLGEDGRPIKDDGGKALKGPNYWQAEPRIRELLLRDAQDRLAAAYGENSGY